MDKNNVPNPPQTKGSRIWVKTIIRIRQKMFIFWLRGKLTELLKAQKNKQEQWTTYVGSCEWRTLMPIHTWYSNRKKTAQKIFDILTKRWKNELQTWDTWRRLYVGYNHQQNSHHKPPPPNKNNTSKKLKGNFTKILQTTERSLEQVFISTVKRCKQPAVRLFPARLGEWTKAKSKVHEWGIKSTLA